MKTAVRLGHFGAKPDPVEVFVQDADERKRLVKEAFKEAFKEWLDDKFTTLGKWTARAIAALALGALLYFILWVNGWHK